MTTPGIPFPPLGAPGLASIATADVREDPSFRAVAAALEAAPPDRTLEALDRSTEWVLAAIRSANDARFHFELTGMHPDGLEPQVTDVGSLAAPWIGRPAVSVGRSTAKLVVLLGLLGSGGASLVARGLDADVHLKEGTMCIAPAFLTLGLERIEAGLDVLVLAVEGPAFR
jgi:hypothetical protein